MAVLFAAFAAHGAQAALITMGARGAVFSDGGQCWFLPAPNVPTANPIGSGDSVAAGYAAGLVGGQTPLASAILGIACGAANALTLMAGHVTKSAVRQLLPQITSTPV